MKVKTYPLRFDSEVSILGKVISIPLGASVHALQYDNLIYKCGNTMAMLRQAVFEDWSSNYDS